MRLLTFAITALMVWALPSAVAQAGVPDPKPLAGVSKVARPALAKALNRCRAIKRPARRKACVRKVRRNFVRRQKRRAVKPVKPVVPNPGALHRVDVMDTYETDYFSPDHLEIEVGDRIEWIWSDLNQNPHPISLESGPAGVNRLDFMTANAPSRNYRWVRRLDKPGLWTFVCPLHHLMKMTVKVGK